MLESDRLEGPVQWSTSNGIATITLARPEKLNALNAKMRSLLFELCSELATRSDVRAVALLGKGRSFCAGQDMHEASDRGPSPTESLDQQLQHDFLKAVSDLPQPTVVGLQGHCLGRGLMLALACCIRIAAGDALLGYPELKLGLLPGGGGTQRLTKAVGPARALHMVLTAEPVNAETALQWGLVTKVVPRAELEQAVLGVAELIAEHPGPLVRLARTAVEVGTATQIPEGVTLEKALSTVVAADPALSELRKRRWHDAKRAKSQDVEQDLL